MRGLIVFDLDGTLVDTLDDLTASANRLLAHHGAGPLIAAQLRPMIGDGIDALVRRLLAHAGLATPERAAIERFTQDYERNPADASRLFDGAAETLHRLHETGWKLAVCTNKPVRPARILLEALGVARWLCALGGGDSFATRKPDPGHLLGTIAAAGGVPSRAIMVGDHRNDIEAAAAARVSSIFALWGYGTEAMAAGKLAVGTLASARSIRQIPAIAERLLPAA